MAVGLNPQVEALVEAILPPDFFALRPEDFARKAVKPSSPPVLSFGNRGLLSGKDFILPELVTYAENGDPSVALTGDSSDLVQVEQALTLAEFCAAGAPLFAELPHAEQQLQRRQYFDYLRRQPKSDVARRQRETELAVWLERGPEAEANFLSWWTRKQERKHSGLFRKSNRLANCGQTGRRLDCRTHPDHKFFGAFRCQSRYCRACGIDIFSGLFSKYSALWNVVKQLLSPAGFRPRAVIAKLDFTAVNLGRMPIAKEIREFNQDVRECIRRVAKELGIGTAEYGFLWCDEFGGWDNKRNAYNTNLHAHGVYVGPFLPQAVLAAVWAEIRAKRDGARIVWIQRQHVDGPPSRDFLEVERHRFTRALGHALKYTGKHVSRSDARRLAELEVAFYSVRRVHTMGAFYHADLSCHAQCAACKAQCAGTCDHEGEHRCKSHRRENACPYCGGQLGFPRETGYALVSELKKEGRRDLAQARKEVAREQLFRGPRGPDEAVAA